MHKLILVFLLILSMLVTLASCFNNENLIDSLFGDNKNDNDSSDDNTNDTCDDGYSIVDDFGLYEYGFMEKYEHGDKYLIVNSFKISETYNTSGISTDGSGYFVILGVDTNLTEDDLSNTKNEIFFFDSMHDYKLNFVLWNAENKELVYEIPKKPTPDYSVLEKLRIVESDSECDAFLDVTIYVLRGNEDYGTIIIDGAQYSGKCIRLNFEV